MHQIVIARRLQGRGIFVTEDRNEPNMAPTPTPGGEPKERPVILGRKLAAKERRTLLEVRNRLRDKFAGTECHISPTGTQESTIEGPCMACPVCYIHGGLRSGKGGNYGRPGIVLYDDAFSMGDSEMETLTLNAVSTKTFRTGTALATETFVYGGTFVNVVTVKHDAPEILALVVDGILSTQSYGARTRHYGRMKNDILGIFKGPRPAVTSYGLVGAAKDVDQLRTEAGRVAVDGGMLTVPVPTLGTPEDVLLAAHGLPDVEAWYEEVRGYLG